MKYGKASFPVLLLGLLIPVACGSPEKDASDMADLLEKSLFRDVLNRWYPLNIDSLHGGYISGFERDWSLSTVQQKSLVQQARHTWTTAFVAQHFPERVEYRSYSEHGFRFLADQMWDTVYGGFLTFTGPEGKPLTEDSKGKLAYGQSFAIYGLSQFYELTGEQEALDLAVRAFHWLDSHARDQENGAYFEFLEADGTPVPDPGEAHTAGRDEPGLGLKDYNSSIHILEALTMLHHVWPDSLVRARLEEMFILIRDTFVHPDGYLQLYFYPDWTLVPEEIMRKRSGGRDYFSQHISYGHDVETAFLLTEAAGELGLGTDPQTLVTAKRLVDHSLASGWDGEKGGFFYMGRKTKGQDSIINTEKSFWVEAEALNALLLMHSLYPEDTAGYYGKFLATWDYIDRYLIDHAYGGWFSSGTDLSPATLEQQKSHGWKTTYHNTRSLVHCIHRLRE